MKNDKFELTSETKVEFGVTLHRIKALKSFGYVSKEELGGWVEKESNVSVSGNAWVSGNARVSGDARVFGKLKAGLFFGVKWLSATEIKQIEIEDGNYLVYKGEAEFGDDEEEVTEMTMEEVCKALEKPVKIKKSL